MTLNSEHFISRMLWHVPVKGQHNVRYYGLYVPGADGQRDEIRRQLGQPVGEEVAPVPKRERVCRLCGAPLVHYRSTWRKISVIRCNRPLEGGEVVQQGVRADRAGVRGLHRWAKLIYFCVAIGGSTKGGGGKRYRAEQSSAYLAG